MTDAEKAAYKLDKRKFN